MKKTICQLLGTVLLLGLNVSAATAHSAVITNLPKLKVPFVHSHFVVPTRIPGFSQSSSTFYFQAKNIAQSSISLGLLRGATSYQGPIATGQLYGTSYENFGGPAYQAFPLTYFGIQGNPYNNGAFGPLVNSGIPSFANQLSFTPASAIKIKSGGGVILVSPHLPASARTLQK
jgi:hypothetical protein